MKNKISHKISYNAQAKCQKLESFFGAVPNAVSPALASNNVSLGEGEKRKE